MALSSSHILRHTNITKRRDDAEHDITYSFTNTTEGKLPREIELLMFKLPASSETLFVTLATHVRALTK